MVEGQIQIRKKLQVTLPQEVCEFLACRKDSQLYFLKQDRFDKEGQVYKVALLSETHEAEGFKVKVRDRNQITLPRAIANDLGVGEGLSLKYMLTDSTVLIYRIDRFLVESS